MDYLNGSILTKDGFIEGCVGISEGHICEISRRKASNPVISNGIIIPSFVNAHTHVGDAFIRMELKGSVEELVAPPHGLKHRLLSEANESEVITGIQETAMNMVMGGTTRFWDFRESGVKGAKMLYQGCLGSIIEPVCLGRPSGLHYDAKEVQSLLRACDGIGVSSIRDWSLPDLQKLALDTRRAGKLFALHSSEVVREDIDAILELKPLFLVHMLTATESDFERCADASVPIVVCPRSNAFFGLLPNIPLMVSKGVDVLLGTDNAMLGAPSMLTEMDFAFRISKFNGHISAQDVLSMAVGGRKGLSRQDNFGLQIGQRVSLTVLDVQAGAHPYSALLRATDANVALVWMGERKWQRRGEQPKGIKTANQRKSPRIKRHNKLAREP